MSELVKLLIREEDEDPASFDPGQTSQLALIVWSDDSVPTVVRVIMGERPPHREIIRAIRRAFVTDTRDQVFLVDRVHNLQA